MYYVPGIGVEVVDVDIHALGRIPAHEREALRRQTIRARSIRADFPLNTDKIDPVPSRHSIHTASERHSAGSSSAEGMVIGLVDRGVVVEVFLHVDNVVAILREVLAYLSGVVGFVAGHVVSLKDLRETGDVVGECCEFTVGWCGVG